MEIVPTIHKPLPARGQPHRSVLLYPCHGHHIMSGMVECPGGEEWTARATRCHVGDGACKTSPPTTSVLQRRGDPLERLCRILSMACPLCWGSCKAVAVEMGRLVVASGDILIWTRNQLLGASPRCLRDSHSAGNALVILLQ